MLNLVSLQEASSSLRVNINTLKYWLQSGKIKASKAGNYNGKPMWLVNIDDAKSYLDSRQKQKTVKPQASEYDFHYTQWMKGLQFGILSKKPLSQKSLKCHEGALKNYWKCLDTTPCISKITAHHLKTALYSIPISEENCHFALREHMYKAIRSFMKYLITINEASELDLVELSKLKPRRLTPAKRPKLKIQQAERLFQVLERSRKTEYHKARLALMMTLVLEAGLRVGEALAVKWQDLDSDMRLLHVMGKGKKPRLVPVSEKVRHLLKTWKACYWNPKSSTVLDDWTYSAVRTALNRITEKTGDEINWHGFRRTCATWWAENNVPLTHVQKLLGHANITTTQIYVESDSRDVAEYMLKFYKSKI